LTVEGLLGRARARRDEEGITMNRKEVALASPCGRSFSAMTPVDGGRLCDQCQTVVQDLSALTEARARALLASADRSQLCVRYLFDPSGRVVFAGDADTARANIVPSHRLSRGARARVRQAALLAAPLVLFEACGGGPGDPLQQNWAPAIGSDGGSEDAADGSADGDAPLAPVDEGGVTGHDVGTDR
jgi:hypothetical protein